jgi:hypothetical protein
MTPDTWTPLLDGRSPSRLCRVAPGVLVARCGATDQAKIESLLSLVERQENAFPRPHDLCRDDNHEAVAALAARIRSTDDELESLWLAHLTTWVDHPTRELAEAIFHRLDRVRASGEGKRHALHYRALAHCGAADDVVIASIEAELREEAEIERRHLYFCTLAELGSKGIAALAKQLERDANQADEDEIKGILALIASRRRAAQGVVPALVEMLPRDWNGEAQKTLRAVDPQGDASRLYVKRELSKGDLSEQDRERLEFLMLQIDSVFVGR